MAAFAFEAISRALLQADTDTPAAVWPVSASAAERQRFDVHRNTVLHSLVTALAEGFPSVLKLVGEPYFRAMGAEAVRASPPRHPVLLAYGAEFPEFLEQFAPLAGLPYLADVARLDGLRRRAWHAPDAAPLEPVRLGALPIAAVAELRIGLHPSAAMLSSAHPARSIWLAQNDAAEDSAALHGGQRTLIWRRAGQVHLRALDARGGALHACLHALRDGPRVDQLLNHPSATAGFAEALSLGLIVSADAAATDPLFDPFTTPSGTSAGIPP